MGGTTASVTAAAVASGATAGPASLGGGYIQNFDDLNAGDKAQAILAANTAGKIGYNDVVNGVRMTGLARAYWIAIQLEPTLYDIGNGGLIADQAKLSAWIAGQEGGYNQAFGSAKPQSQSSGIRRLGFEHDEFKKDREDMAILQPEKFIQLAKADRRRIESDVADFYTKTVDRYLEYGYDITTAENKSKASALSLKKLLMKGHNEEYPSTLNQEIRKKNRINK